VQSFSKKLLILGVVVAFFAGSANHASAAQLLLSPSSGTFLVGSTFDVGVFVDTEGKSANVVEATILFPPDILQLVSPTISQSVFSVWTAQPVFDNQKGIIKLSGGIPGGINVSRGLITNLTFRVKQVTDSAIVRFSDASSVLANDGKGTSILSNAQSAVYKFILPPPAGPIVTSETHPDQSKWYAAKDLILKWASLSQIEQFSYILSRNPTDVPDDIPDGSKSNITYKNVSDGKNYFHIKSLRDGVWGGTTHFAVNIDSEIPASFSVDVSPSDYTSSKFQLISFETTDTLSGMDHYEMRVINLTSTDPSSPSGGDTFFVESTSPKSLSLGLGKYDLIVRAYNKVGNYREVTKRLSVVKPIFGIITDRGMMIGSIGTVPWFLVFIFLLFIIACLAFVSLRVHKWHDDIVKKRITKELPDDIKAQLADLKKYRQKYGKALVALLVIGLFAVGSKVNAEQKQVQLSPPNINSVSHDISNQDIFYIGGTTDSSGITVTVYLQNSTTNETWSDDVVSGAKGGWFYRHPTFLSPGNYLIWTQSKIGSEQSPPSPQIGLTVSRTALQFGSSRLSYESIYLFFVMILLVVSLLLTVHIVYHSYHARRKHKMFIKEIKDADESIRRGFAVLRRDIEAELNVVKRAKLTGELSAEEKEKEEQLMKDLESISTYTGKEIWEIEQMESRP
jgi:hypothetical protein